MTRDEELRAIEQFVRQQGVLRCPSEHEIALSNTISLILESPLPRRGKGAEERRRHQRRYRLPFEAQRVRDG